MNNQGATLFYNIKMNNSSIKFGLKNVIKFMKSNKVISTDGLTLTEVFQALTQMLNGNLELVKKVLECASVITNHGMNVAKESQLNRSDVLRAIESKGGIVSRQAFRPPSIPTVKITKNKSRGM